MNLNKIVRILISILYPVAALYFCWWVMGHAGELKAGTILLIMTINYIWLMHKLVKIG
jgi:hypothetical protein